MKRRYAYSVGDDYSLLEINESFFRGYACFLRLQNIEKPLVVYNGKENICIRDNGYEWIEVYPSGEKYAITIMYDDKGNLIEWYFDIAKRVGLENEIPYEDDLYLDLIITPSGERIVVDEDELITAKENGDITLEDFYSAYEVLKELDAKYVNNLESLIKLTDYLRSRFKFNYAN